jgi:hypothetical protein
MKKTLLTKMGLALIMALSLSLANAQEPPVTYFTFEDGTELPAFQAIGGVYDGVVDNPATDAVNGSAKVGKSTTGNNAWDGIRYYFANKLDLRKDTVFTMMVYHPTATDTRIRLHFFGDYELKSDETYYNTPGEWQLLEWHLDKEHDMHFNSVGLIFAHTNHSPGQEWFFDDLKGPDVYPEMGAELYFDFEVDPQPELENAGATFDGVVANPVTDGANPSENVGKFTTGNNPWDGVVYRVSTTFDLRNDTIFTMMVYHPTLEGSTRLQFNGDAAELKLNVEYTTPGEWQLLTWRVPKEYHNQFNRVMLVFAHDRSGSGEEWLFDELRGAPQTPPDETPPKKYYYSTNYRKDWSGFSGAEYMGVVANPDTDNEVHWEAETGLAVTGSASWAGMSYDLPAPIEFGFVKRFVMSVYSAEAGRVRIMLEDGGQDPKLRLWAQYTTPGEWQQLVFDASDSEGEFLDGVYDRIVLIFDDENSDAGKQWYFDKLYGPMIADPGPQVTYFDFQSAVELSFTGFSGGAYIGELPNPDPDDVNDAPEVGMSMTGGDFWSGLFYYLPSTISFDEGRSFSTKIYTADRDTVMEGAGRFGDFRIELRGTPHSNDTRLRMWAEYTDMGNWVDITLHADESIDLPESGIRNDFYHTILMIFDDKRQVSGEEWYFHNIMGPMLTPVYYADIKFQVHSYMEDVQKYEIEINDSGERIPLELVVPDPPEEGTKEDDPGYDTWFVDLLQLPVGAHSMNIYADDVLLDDGTNWSFEVPEISRWMEEVTFVHQSDVSVPENGFGTSTISMYPNPVRNALTIESPIMISEYQIYDIVGKVVLHDTQSARNTVVNTAVLKSGVYFIRILDETGTLHTHKFIKE